MAVGAIEVEVQSAKDSRVTVLVFVYFSIQIC